LIMAFETGTYGSTIYSITPSKLLPSPDSMITWDWMNALGEFSQRFYKMATVIATIASAGSYLFDYSALRCDYFPPYLKLYVRESGQFNQFIGTAPVYDNVSGLIQSHPYFQFTEIGLGSSMVVNHTGTSQYALLMAYL